MVSIASRIAEKFTDWLTSGYVLLPSRMPSECSTVLPEANKGAVEISRNGTGGENLESAGTNHTEAVPNQDRNSGRRGSSGHPWQAPFVLFMLE